MVRAGRFVDGLKTAGVEFFAGVPVMFPCGTVRILPWGPIVSDKKTDKKTNKKPRVSVGVRLSENMHLTEASKLVLDAILKTPEILIAHLSRITKLSIEGVRYQIAKLKTMVGLVHVGPDKGGHWEVVGSDE